MKLSSWKQVAVSLLVLAAVFIAYSFAGGSFNSGCVQAPSNQAQSGATTSYQQGQKEDGQGQINVSDLPSEALDTLRLIKQGGPFPYSKDGTVFSNNEGLLPRKSQAYYHEYTVITPGSPDRGARRIVAGDAGEYYYTDDHYSSFKRIRE